MHRIARERAAKKMHDDITSLKEQIRKLEKTVDYQEYTKLKDDNIDPRVLETINEYWLNQSIRLNRLEKTSKSRGKQIAIMVKFTKYISKYNAFERDLRHYKRWTKKLRWIFLFH